MDEHQRRVWARMAESVDVYRAGGMDLRRLVQDLQGLMGAAGLHRQALIDEFWCYEAPIDMELELQTEDWAPPGSGNDQALDRALAAFQRWVMEVLASTDDELT